MDTRTARQLLAELELISHGTTQSWNPSGGHSAERPAMPPGELNPPHIALRARLQAAQTQTQVDRVARAARDALTAAKYTKKDARLIYGTHEWRHAIGTDERTAEVVADVYGITMRHVHRLRALCRDKAA